jgi:hypothetical protein
VVRWWGFDVALGRIGDAGFYLVPNDGMLRVEEGQNALPSSCDPLVDGRHETQPRRSSVSLRSRPQCRSLPGDGIRVVGDGDDPRKVRRLVTPENGYEHYGAVVSA